MKDSGGRNPIQDDSVIISRGVALEARISGLAMFWLRRTSALVAVDAAVGHALDCESIGDDAQCRWLLMTYIASSNSTSRPEVKTRFAH